MKCARKRSPRARTGPICARKRVTRARIGLVCARKQTTTAREEAFGSEIHHKRSPTPENSHQPPNQHTPSHETPKALIIRNQQTFTLKLCKSIPYLAKIISHFHRKVVYYNADEMHHRNYKT